MRFESVNTCREWWWRWKERWMIQPIRKDLARDMEDVNSMMLAKGSAGCEHETKWMRATNGWMEPTERKMHE